MVKKPVSAPNRSRIPVPVHQQRQSTTEMYGPCPDTKVSEGVDDEDLVADLDDEETFTKDQQEENTSTYQCG